MSEDGRNYRTDVSTYLVCKDISIKRTSQPHLQFLSVQRAVQPKIVFPELRRVTLIRKLTGLLLTKIISRNRKPQHLQCVHSAISESRIVF